MVKYYFASTSDELCKRLQDFEKEELEDLGYELYEAIPEDDPHYTFCSHYTNAVEKSDCRKAVCPYYTSKGGRGVCSHRGGLFSPSPEPVNVKHLYERMSTGLKHI